MHDIFGSCHARVGVPSGQTSAGHKPDTCPALQHRARQNTCQSCANNEIATKMKTDFLILYNVVMVFSGIYILEV